MARLVVLAGLPGAGKTTVAAWLRQEHAFSIASRDVIRAAMFPGCRFTAAEKDAAFQAMKAAIAIMLEQGMSVVTDGICFSSSGSLEEVLAIGRQAGVPIDIIECSCPVRIAQQRVEADRMHDPSVPADRDATLVRQVADRFDPLPAAAVWLDTSRPLTDVRREATRLLALERSA